MHGARNVNFVTPTPHAHTVLKIVRKISVNTPVVWNSNMYHSPEIAEILEGVVDVYLGDFKYGNDICARKYSKIKKITWKSCNQISNSPTKPQKFSFAILSCRAIWNAVQGRLPNGLQKISRKSGSISCSSTGHAIGLWSIQRLDAA